MTRSAHHSFEPRIQIVAFDSSKTLLGGRYTDRGVSRTSHVGRGTSSPSPLPSPPPFPFPSLHPFLSSLPSLHRPTGPLSPLSLPLPPLPSPSRHLHSLPLPLEVGLLIAANGLMVNGLIGALAPPEGPGRARQPNGIWFILN